MRLTAAVTQEGDLYVAQCLEVDVASQGESLDIALANLKEALELYFEDAPPSQRAPVSPIIAPVDINL
jgi:predicted RNase H-like HicB family nuclease